MIVLDNVTCGYQKKKVLSDVSIEIRQKNLTCLLGKNGVGKTTLFKTILGLLPIIKGEITYNDKKKDFIHPKQFAKLISYVPQANHTPFPYKVLDVVVMGQYIHSSGAIAAPGKHNFDIAIECIETLGIEHLTHRNFSKLSGGERQMVLIARAMAQQPDYIALDEPTANLDMGNRAQVLQTLCKLRDKGYGILMNTHSPQQVLRYADTVILLKDQGVVGMGKPSEVLTTGTVTELYNTPLEIIDTVSQSGDKRKVLIHL